MGTMTKFTVFAILWVQSVFTKSFPVIHRVIIKFVFVMTVAAAYFT